MIRLTCTAMAFPAIHTVVWRKDGTAIGQLPPYIINTVTSGTTLSTTETTLSIENAQKEYSGVYECELTSNTTSINSEATVSVQGMHKMYITFHTCMCEDDIANTKYFIQLFLFTMIAPPVITTYPEDVTVTRPAEAVFYCTATGQPRPTIIWLRDGEPIQSGVGQYTVTESPVPDDVTSINSALTISSTTYEYAAVYSCYVSNEDGNSTAGAILSVLGV